MRPPDTVLPDGLNPFEVQEAYRALKGHALRDRDLRRRRLGRGRQPVHRDRAELHRHLPAAHRPEPARGVLRQPARDGVVPLRARPRRPAGRPRADPGDRRLRQRPAQRLDRVSAPAPGTRRRSRRCRRRRRRCSPTTRPGCTCAAPSAATPTRSTTWPPGRMPTGCRCRRPSTRRRSPASPPRSRAPGSPACSPSTRSTGRAASGRRCGPGRTTCPTSRSRPPTSTGPERRRPRLPAGSSRSSGSCYRSDDLTALLPLGQLQPLALPGQSYQAALTPGPAVGASSAPLVPTATLTEGGYVQLAGETGWWRPSSRVFYSAGDTDTPPSSSPRHAPDSSRPAAPSTRSAPSPTPTSTATRCLPVTVTDPVGNVTSAASDYRVLLPATVTDPNGNRVVGRLRRPRPRHRHRRHGQDHRDARRPADRLRGRPGRRDADRAVHRSRWPIPAAILGNATTRFLYDLGAYQRTSYGRAAVAARRLHPGPRDARLRPGRAAAVPRRADGDQVPVPLRLLRRLRPGDPAQGPGRAGPASPKAARRSRRAGPGPAGRSSTTRGARSRRYEPFFSATNAFEFDAQTGVSTVMCYDPPGRRRGDAAPGQQLGQGSVRPVVGAALGRRRHRADRGSAHRRRRRRLLPAAARNRVVHVLVRAAHRRHATARRAQDQAAQQDAAQKAAAAAATPAVTHRDALGRACLAVADNGGGARYPVPHRL